MGGGEAAESCQNSTPTMIFPSWSGQAPGGKGHSKGCFHAAFFYQAAVSLLFAKVAGTGFKHAHCFPVAGLEKTVHTLETCAMGQQQSLNTLQREERLQLA